MSFGLEVENVRWRLKIEELMRAMRVDAKQFLLQRFRLLMEKAMQFTPPHTLAEGRAAVARDVLRAVSPFPYAQTKDKRVKKLWRDRNYAAFNAFAAAIGQPWTAAPFSAQLHEGQRTARGTVNRRRRRVFVLGRADTGELSRYKKHKQDNVGIAKSGWLIGLWGSGGRATDWITRHGFGFGTFTNASMATQEPYLEARNRSPWARRRDEGDRALANAMVSARQNMDTELRLYLERAAAATGFAA